MPENQAISSAPVAENIPTTQAVPTPSSPVASPAPVNPPAEPSFFWKLVSKVSSIFTKTTDIAGKTIQTWANVIWNVATTAVNTGTNLTQWIWEAVQNNQSWSVIQNIVWATKEIASTTVSSAVTAGTGVVDAGKQTISSAVEIGKDTVQSVAGDSLNSVAEKMNEFTDKAMDLWSTATAKVGQTLDSITDKVSDVVHEIKNENEVNLWEIQKPVEAPLETPVETPAPAETPVETPITSSILNELSDTPVASPAQVETSLETPVETPVEIPVVSPEAPVNNI